MSIRDAIEKAFWWDVHRRHEIPARGTIHVHKHTATVAIQPLSRENRALPLYDEPVRVPPNCKRSVRLVEFTARGYRFFRSPCTQDALSHLDREVTTATCPLSVTITTTITTPHYVQQIDSFMSLVHCEDANIQ